MTKQSLLAQVQPNKVALCSPLQLMLIVAVSITGAEIALMFLFEQLPQMPPLVENFADGILLTLFLFPILYLFLFRPLSRQVLALEQVEKSLSQQNGELKETTWQLLAAQEELVRHEKPAVLGQAAISVGQELRNPLGAMNNAVYFLQTVLADADETTKVYLDIIKDEIAASERIVSILLDAVHTPPPQPVMVGGAELVGQALGKFNIPACVTVKLDIPATLSPLRVDAMQIHRVLCNLISNSVEAMPNGGTLEIRAVENKPDATIAVSVRDSGCGIAADVLPKLFQLFFTTKARGIGLGLVVVKNLTEANGGTLTVQSEVGKGTVFTLTLPADDVQNKYQIHS